MTIERLHIEGGIPTGEQEVNVSGLIKKAAQLRLITRVTLTQGTHDLTPSHWRSHGERHQLTVLPDGTGVYEERGKGLSWIQIPSEQALATVVGPMPETTARGLYEVIVYHFGRNPSRRCS